MRPYVLALILVFSACSQPAGPDTGLAGLFTATGRPDVQLYLYDDAPGTEVPEQFYLRHERPSFTYLWWGEYDERDGSLSLRPYAPELPIAGEAWIDRPQELTLSATGFGTLRFVRD